MCSQPPQSSQVPQPTATPPAPVASSPTSQIPEPDAARARTPQEAERFFRRIALENQPPSRTMRWLSIGGWVAGTCKSCSLGSVGRLIPQSVVPGGMTDPLWLVVRHGSFVVSTLPLYHVYISDAHPSHALFLSHVHRTISRRWIHGPIRRFRRP
jgi:hypothetical protein